MTNADDAREELLRRIQTEGVLVAYETALAVCRDPKATASAKATASGTLFRVAGYFDRSGDDTGDTPVEELSLEDLQRRIKRADSAAADRAPPDPFS